MGSGGLSEVSPLVSVVIPTVGRPELARAVRSVRAQDLDGAVELILVADLAPDQHSLPPEAVAEADVVLWTGGGRRGGHARNRGVAASSGQWIAFLDDDDEWLSSKLREQLCLAARYEEHELVVSSRHVQIDPRTGRTSGELPTTTISVGERPENYLFIKRHPGGGRASLFTSSLLCRRDLAVRVPWDESLPRHQDWDWMIRLTRDAGAHVVQHPAPLVRIYTGSTGSISAGSEWEDSLTWARRVFGMQGSRVGADFVAAQTLRYAFASHSWRGVKECLRYLARNGKVPNFGPMAIGVGGSLPRRWIETLMTYVR